MPNPPKNNTPDKALVERLRASKANCNFGSTLCARDAHMAADAIERLSQPQHGGLVEALRECRDQLWLLAKDPENNPWIKQADAALASNSSVVGEDAPWAWGWYDEGGKKHAYGYLPTVDHPIGDVEIFPLYRHPAKPTPTDTADRRGAVARWHNIKCWPGVFEEMVEGRKTAEFRLNDRDYQVGDGLLIREWCPNLKEYTHREIERQITHVLKDGFGVPKGYAMLSLASLIAGPPEGKGRPVPICRSGP